MIKKESQFTESIKNFREIILSNKNLAIETYSDFRKKMAEFSFFRLELNIWIAKFSRNDNLNSLKLDILNIDEFLEKFWYKEILKVDSARGRKDLDEFKYDNYVHILWFFSISILLESEKGSKTVSTIIKECEVQDLIFNYYINHVFDEDQNLVEESYTRFFMIPQKFKRLREIILEQNLDTCKIMIKQYLKKNWLKSYNKYGSEMGLESTKTQNGGKYFFGFWAFEVAAVAKLKGFGEEEFKHLPYFPTFNDK